MFTDLANDKLLNQFVLSFRIARNDNMLIDCELTSYCHFKRSEKSQGFKHLRNTIFTFDLYANTILPLSADSRNFSLRCQ